MRRAKGFHVAGAILAVGFFASACASLGSGSSGTAVQNVLFSSQASVGSVASAEEQRLADFYRARRFRAAWTSGEAQERMAMEARAFLARAGEQGLRPEDYTVPSVALGAEGTAEAAQYDVALSRAVLRYANDVRMGRVRPDDVYRDVELPTQNFEFAEALNSAIENNSVAAFFDSLPPPHLEYRQLVAALAVYRGIAGENAPRTLARRVALDKDSPELRALIDILKLEDSDFAAFADPSPVQIGSGVRRFRRATAFHPTVSSGRTLCRPSARKRRHGSI
jgi:murein L,D-transpeptidase YcbB/YkuD